MTAPDGPRSIDRLVLVGSVIVDIAVDLPHLPQRGADVLAGGMRSTPGGGFNVLAAARRLGLPAALAGHVGDGPHGVLVRAGLAGIDVPVLLDTVGGGDTGGVLVLLEPDGEHTFVTAPGVESRLTDDDLALLAPRPTDAVYVSGYELLYPVSGPAICSWLDAVRPALLVLDPGPLVAQIEGVRLDAVLARTHVLTLTARELCLLGGDATALRARMAAGGVVVVREGARGAVLHTDDGAVHVPSVAVAAVDTTGAGDAHTGALLASLFDGMTLPDAVARANRAAAISVTRRGSATGPTLAELDGVEYPDL